MKRSSKTKRRPRRKCPHCKEMYLVDSRVRTSQVYCSKQACQAESKRISQARWRAKNPTYFSDGSSTARSQACRERKRADRAALGTDLSNENENNRPLPVDDKEVTGISNLVAESEMQQETIELFSSRNPLFLGLVSMVTGAMQQDEIDSLCQKVFSLGRDVLGISP